MCRRLRMQIKKYSALLQQPQKCLNCVSSSTYSYTKHHHVTFWLLGHDTARQPRSLSEPYPDSSAAALLFCTTRFALPDCASISSSAALSDSSAVSGVLLAPEVLLWIQFPYSGECGLLKSSASMDFVISCLLFRLLHNTRAAMSNNSITTPLITLPTITPVFDFSSFRAGAGGQYVLR